MSKVVQPGKTIGMLGGGQLGRMSILAGRQLGYRFVVLEPKADSAAAMVADEQVPAAYDDPEGLKQLAAKVDVITLEFENIPVSALETVEETGVDVFPGKQSLHVAQNREREKHFLEKAGFPCAPFRVISSLEELEQGVSELGTPSVLKTADFGYDGKGQSKVTGGDDLSEIWSAYEGQRMVLEKWIPFDGEYSVICARSACGEEKAFPVFGNSHRDHILHTTVSPSGLDPDLEREAESLAMSIARELNHVGLLTVEFFLVGKLWMVNELAPRPHNSGHLTIDAHQTSQFEQHIRAVCGLPLGDTRLLRPGCMLNVLGDVWEDMHEAPSWSDYLESGDVKLHLYDKGEPRPGRKMGHFSVLADNAQSALAKTLEMDRKLYSSGL